MKKTVHEVSKLTGISIRALHYYDEIGLLKPSEYTNVGYRLYDTADLERLQQILFFKELDFPLKEIKNIFEQPSFDKTDALKKQKELLILKQNRLSQLIDLINLNLEGGNNMSFKEFDMSEIEAAQKQYAVETKERYGKTKAYQESVEKTSKYNHSDWKNVGLAAEKIYQGFIGAMNQDVASEEVQKLVADWKDYITKYFYECTNEILAGLGEMYVADERFTKNIDQHKKGLAQFMSQAIKEYCKK
ncbi:MerR family transcriptional regulator [Paludicola sp. MB14-C6]|uniref:MerR family transcriptional regulator n=1 Tax=Paludihabitans sp. MB14-C6 TaxID=3070656 RepID=UPI0027DC213D|nr:MerR family transcriptional regulator [Paludicola sp. MB14-C6]WMJ23862.1 MerR family transcriptional regulator [Paludicola sp. MB14-C6]